MQRPLPTAAASVLLLLIAPLSALLSACSGDTVMATMGMPTTESAPAHGRANAAPPGPPSANGQSNALVVTGRQRGYLDALAAAGITPSSDLIALSIGSYICQARVAKHDEQAVWDSVRPLVHSDVVDRGDRMSAMPPPPAEIDALTSDYIRIATERLC